MEDMDVVGTTAGKDSSGRSPDSKMQDGMSTPNRSADTNMARASAASALFCSSTDHAPPAPAPKSAKYASWKSVATRLADTVAKELRVLARRGESQRDESSYVADTAPLSVDIGSAVVCQFQRNILELREGFALPLLEKLVRLIPDDLRHSICAGLCLHTTETLQKRAQSPAGKQMEESAERALRLLSLDQAQKAIRGGQRGMFYDKNGPFGNFHAPFGTTTPFGNSVDQNVDDQSSFSSSTIILDTVSQSLIIGRYDSFSSFGQLDLTAFFCRALGRAPQLLKLLRQEFILGRSLAGLLVQERAGYFVAHELLHLLAAGAGLEGPDAQRNGPSPAAMEGSPSPGGRMRGGYAEDDEMESGEEEDQSEKDGESALLDRWREAAEFLEKWLLPMWEGFFLSPEVKERVLGKESAAAVLNWYRFSEEGRAMSGAAGRGGFLNRQSCAVGRGGSSSSLDGGIAAEAVQEGSAPGPQSSGSSAQEVGDATPRVTSFEAPNTRKKRLLQRLSLCLELEQEHVRPENGFSPLMASLVSGEKHPVVDAFFGERRATELRESWRTRVSYGGSSPNSHHLSEITQVKQALALPDPDDQTIRSAARLVLGCRATLLRALVHLQGVVAISDSSLSVSELNPVLAIDTPLKTFLLKALSAAVPFEVAQTLKIQGQDLAVARASGGSSNVGAAEVQRELDIYQHSMARTVDVLGNNATNGRPPLSPERTGPPDHPKPVADLTQIEDRVYAVTK